MEQKRNYVRIPNDESMQMSINDTAVVQDVTYELPVGLQYHFFVSHAKEDAEEVVPFITSLENQYSIKCLLHSRDFIGGTYILENIREGVEKSKAILCFLSQAFVDSDFCRFELEAADADIRFARSRKCSIIPILLSPCNIPKTIKDVTYIDFSDSKDIVAERIMRTFKGEDKVCVNGVILLESKAYKVNPLFGTAWEFPFPTTDSSNTNEHNVNPEIFEKIATLLDTINKSWKWRYFDLFNNWARFCIASICVGCLFPIIALIVVYSITLANEMDGTKNQKELMSILGVVTLIVIMTLFTVCGMKICLKSKIPPFMWRSIWCSASDFYYDNSILPTFGYSKENKSVPVVSFEIFIERE